MRDYRSRQCGVDLKGFLGLSTRTLENVISGFDSFLLALGKVLKPFKSYPAVPTINLLCVERSASGSAQYTSSRPPHFQAHGAIRSPATGRPKSVPPIPQSRRERAGSPLPARPVCAARPDRRARSLVRRQARRSGHPQSPLRCANRPRPTRAHPLWSRIGD